MSYSNPQGNPPGIFFSLPDLGLPTDQSSLIQLWLSAQQATYGPQFAPAAADLDYIQALVFASWAADVAQLASAGATELFRQFGTQLLNLPYEQGNGAIAIVAITTSAPASVATISSAGAAAISTAFSGSTSIAQIGVNAIATAIAAGTIQTVFGINTQTWTTTGAAQGATEIPVTSQVPNFAYPSGAAVTGIATYVLPASTQLTLTLSGTQVGFETAAPLTINGGSTGQIAAVAVQAGTGFNGAGAPAALVSQVDYVTGVSVVTNAAGGVDQENDSQYLIRLANTLQLLAPRPITASDYSTLAINFTPAAGTDQQEVGRATSIDGYDPPLGSIVNGATYTTSAVSGPGNTYGNEREVTVCITDTSGNALNNDTAAAVSTYLTALREINFVVNVVSPNYTTIYVAVTVNAATGYTASVVQTNVQAAILNYLTPANFGLPIGSLTGWTNSQTIYASRLSSVIQGALGVSSIPSGGLFFDVNPSPTNTTDLTILGAFPLVVTSPSSVPLGNITVNVA